MRALLLAAGLGTRLRPLTDTIPKCLVPIVGKPLLEYWFKLLSDAGVHPVLVNTHYFPEKVMAHIENSRFSSIVKIVHEDELLGTAGTLLANRDFFGDEPLMLIHADNLSKFNVEAFIESHHKRPDGCEITMMTFTTSTLESCGIVELDEYGVVKGFHEKVKNPPCNLANGAVYIIEPSIFGFLEGLGKLIIDFSTEVLPHYIGRIFTFHNNVYHRDIGTIESYEAAVRDFSAWIKE
ncbi:MAG: mannose-1-phosphate guanylyltransferase [Nitrospirae bacterium GWF2_44_13]|nr:MAG: mannose-1-phosphate guanylyltransferase [Nitrospirae bacterium GWF2_44_13]OGW63510.1 MAG: mannose-1-phosphate guanylyltransferase [Nitrospirae bacterium RIFOXYA2_FULL_44_9]